MSVFDHEKICNVLDLVKKVTKSNTRLGQPLTSTRALTENGHSLERFGSIWMSLKLFPSSNSLGPPANAFTYSLLRLALVTISGPRLFMVDIHSNRTLTCRQPNIE